MGLKLQSSGGGSIELVAPVTATAYTQTVQNGTGELLVDVAGTGVTCNSGIYLSKSTIGNMTIPTGYNGTSAGPITISTGSNWTII